MRGNPSSVTERSSKCQESRRRTISVRNCPIMLSNWLWGATPAHPLCLQTPHTRVSSAQSILRFAHVNVGRMSRWLHQNWELPGHCVTWDEEWLIKVTTITAIRLQALLKIKYLYLSPHLAREGGGSVLNRLGSGALQTWAQWRYK